MVSRRKEKRRLGSPRYYRKQIMRLLFFLAGFLFLVVGVLGYILPGLPGTIFLILSAVCFFRSSERFYNLVTGNRWFGSLVKDFLETGVVNKRIKTVSITSIWVFTIFAVTVGIPQTFGLAVFAKLLTVLLAFAGTYYLWSRPDKYS